MSSPLHLWLSADQEAGQAASYSIVLYIQAGTVQLSAGRQVQGGGGSLQFPGRSAQSADCAGSGLLTPAGSSAGGGRRPGIGDWCWGQAASEWSPGLEWYEELSECQAWQ